MTHAELCEIAARYLIKNGIAPFERCRYAVADLHRINENPDAYGWSGGGTTQMIEVKMTHEDFIADKTKFWRKNPEYGIGEFRSYLCPEKIINPDELPENWGLLYVSETGKITKIKTPKRQPSSHRGEISILTSIMRREGIKPQVFRYTKYNNQKK